MSLQKGKYNDIPAGAVRLNRQEAISHQFKVMEKWKYSKDTQVYVNVNSKKYPNFSPFVLSMFFKYGSSLLGGAAMLTGIYTNNYYRRKLFLFRHGQVSSYLPTVLIPSLVAMAAHMEWVIPGVLLQDECAVCTEIRAASIQASVGVLLPTAFATLISFSGATNWATYDLPYITQQPLQVFKVWKKLTKPIGNKLFGLLLAQAMLAAVVTSLESKNVNTVNEKINRIYNQLEESYQQRQIEDR